MSKNEFGWPKKNWKSRWHRLRNDFLTFLIDLRHKIFFCPKKNVSTLLGGFHHLALFFYGLNLRDLHQASGIWCKIGISSLLPQLDWPRSKKTGKITKQCYQTLFLGLMGFNTANNCKLHSDQVSRHSVTKKCDFGPFFNFWTLCTPRETPFL